MVPGQEAKGDNLESFFFFFFFFFYQNNNGMLSVLFDLGDSNKNI